MPPFLSDKLSLKRQHIARVAAAYSTHRPIIQRALTAGFVLYALSTTYQSLFSGSGPHKQSRSKAKQKGGQEGDSKKSQRVAVGRLLLSRIKNLNSHAHSSAR